MERPRLLYQAIKIIQEGHVTVRSQDSISLAGLYRGMRKENDEIIDWNQTSREIFNFIRAVTYPGSCACSFHKGEKIKFVSSELIPNAPVYKGIPGQILVKADNYLFIKTKDSYIKITKYEGGVKVGERLRGGISL